MPATFEDAFERVKQLAADFKANEKFYLSPQYQEAEARRDFIDKFLIALGWDVNHDAQKNPYEQEVKVERKEHGISQRRADYAFYLAPNFRDVKFYIEAKKPFGDIATPDNYFQTIRYGWNSQTPIAALFDFEQFEIVDCRFKPDLETALQRNLKKFHFSQYADEKVFAEIYWLFSREAVAGGSLEKYAEALPKKRGAVQRGLLKGGYQSIDDSFLEELDAHRDTLAHIFKNGNPKLDGEALTEATQRTLDRLVFIRFLEDKLIEPQYLVAKFGERGSAWGDFIATSRRLDGIYNGIVFKKNDILDAPTFKVDDEQFSGICKKLSHINSAYDFNAIPIHILGSIYERFLGKVIVATAKRATVEEKPEVRKAGGVYYTPEYIVRYIVENTVGKLIEGKSPAQIAEMRFADIACGSGSFLLGVYDLLLRYHTKFYNENPGKAKKGDVMPREDGLHLSLQKKRDILVNNLYGVDIDNQAVEVAQLSLYLKLLQDETPGSTRQYFLDFEQQALLPTLNKNIVCGNSLIGTDILSGELFEPVEERKLNPMDYEHRFPDALKRGGFDAIVGNPPYGAELKPLERTYLQKNYEVSITDTAALFVLKQIQLLKPNGLGSFIVPKPLIYASNWKEIRAAMLPTLLELCDCSKVWREVKLEQIIYRLQKGSKQKTYKSFNRNGEAFECLGDIEKQLCEQFDFFLSNVSPADVKLAIKLKKSGRCLSEVIENRRGAMLQSKVHPTNGEFRAIGGKQIGRYDLAKDWKGYIPKKSATDDNAFVGENSVLVQNIVAHIINPTDHIQIIATLLPSKLRKDSLILDTVNQLSVKQPFSAAFVVGLLNSQLVGWFVYRFIFARAIRTMHFDSPITNRIPFPILNLENSADKARHDKLVSLVEQMLAAQPQLARAQSDKDKDFYANKCAALDRQLDALVYELYALTPDEIKIVEGATAKAANEIV